MIEQRKSRRFDLRLPFELIRTGSSKTRLDGETKNLSSVGVLFEAAAEVSGGDAIEYVITLPTAPTADIVRIRCLGKVVRADGNEVAATLERYEFVREPRVKTDPKNEHPDPLAARVSMRRKDAP